MYIFISGGQGRLPGLMRLEQRQEVRGEVSGCLEKELSRQRAQLEGRPSGGSFLPG